MKVEMLVDELSQLIDEAWSLPLSGGKTVINAERARELIEEIKTNMPQEIRQAKNIAADRNTILTKAKEEAESIVQKAEERAKAMITQSEIVRQAQQKSQEIIFDANQKATEIKDAANAYLDNLLKKADEELSANLAQLKKTREGLLAVQKKNTKMTAQHTKKEQPSQQ
ncbi:MAG: ATPase [Acutalibacteraceae bacterium]